MNSWILAQIDHEVISTTYSHHHCILCQYKLLDLVPVFVLVQQQADDEGHVEPPPQRGTPAIVLSNSDQVQD